MKMLLALVILGLAAAGCSSTQSAAGGSSAPTSSGQCSKANPCHGYQRDPGGA